MWEWVLFVWTTEQQLQTGLLQPANNPSAMGHVVTSSNQVVPSGVACQTRRDGEGMESHTQE